MRALIALMLATIAVVKITADCPGSQEVDLHEIAGTWHEYKKSKSWISTGCCVQHDVTLVDDSHIKLELQNLDSSGKTESVLDFDGTKKGKCMELQNGSEKLVINCLAIDDTCAIFATCNQDKIESMVVVTRDKSPNDMVKERVRTALSKIKNKPELKKMDKKCG